jgi:hypothetical protein
VDYKVVAVRATGVMPEAVASDVEAHLQVAGKEGWELNMIQPVIYNSSSTGYFLLILEKPNE